MGSQNMPSAAYEPGTSLDFLRSTKSSGSLEIHLLDAGYNYIYAEVVVGGTSVGVNRCILASRSPFFHDLFKMSNASSESEGRPKYPMPELVPNGKIGYETFMVFLNYVYTGKLRPPPLEVSRCVDESCDHNACGPAINCAVELMYAFASFQIKELVMFVERGLLNFVHKAFVEDVIPIITVAFHCQLTQLLSDCVQRVALSDLDNFNLEKELPHEVLSQVKFFRDHSRQELKQDTLEVDLLYDKRVKRIYKALDSDDVELLKLLLDESDITLDGVHALHYAVAYCSPEVVREVLSLGIADLNLRNRRGYTVLHVAARRKDPTVIVDLLSKGACVSDTTIDGQTAITICRRLTRLKDYNESKTQGQETNTDRLCIDVLQRAMRRNLLATYISDSSWMVADDLLMRRQLLENRGRTVATTKSASNWVSEPPERKERTPHDLMHQTYGDTNDARNDNRAEENAYDEFSLWSKVELSPILQDSALQQPRMEPDIIKERSIADDEYDVRMKKNDSKNIRSMRTLDLEYGITHEALQQHSGKKLQDVAKLLGVSRSTLKRICRKYKIFRWPPQKSQRVNETLVDQDLIHPTKENTEAYILPNALAMRDDSSIMVKATYKEDIIKFQLSVSAKKKDLEKEVSKRLKLLCGSFKIKYLDEDNEWVLVGCNADFTRCINTCGSRGKTPIKMLVS